mmetsp:Transcript_238/g.395  ORF Transcript_238/g.395 Transcript_238/m.395 type:complete len:260 (-) Transcript_238:123-902(-)|eukprot:CAMPEP_0196803188 /NCGR_PEP_ID=MMETSP1362-20130617/2580_1 /TAXON_ID=163516 /ORGANISM="Leptocylindrus danicus, Strain CCMP1856" /LENGTH=259 /DNA_ID=CAMNT_0042174635 /DNA_START=84 /DNA_END=863 /DNA_ORIENTATION=+
MDIDDDEEAQYASVKRQIEEETNAASSGCHAEEHKRFRFWQPQDTGGSPQQGNNINSNGRGPLNGEVKLRRTHSQPPRGAAPQLSIPGLDTKRKLIDYIWKEEWYGATARCQQNPGEVRHWSETRNKKGKIMWRKLPIHAVLKMGKHWQPAHYELVHTMLQMFPESSQCADENGDLPLHIIAGCKNVSSPQLAQLVLSYNPKAIQTSNSNGMLPLHRAYAGGAPPAVLQMIYNAFPQAAQVIDGRNKLPIQYLRAPRER